MWYAEEALCESGRVPPLPQVIKNDPGPPGAMFATEIKVSSCLGLTKDCSGLWVHDQGSDTDRM